MDGASLVAARLAAYAALLLAAGVPLALTFARERGGWRFAGAAALAGMAASVWWVLEAVASMAALPLGQLDAELVRVVLDATPLGAVMAVRIAALLAALVALWWRRMALAALAASLALATIAWTGHAGATESGLGTLHRVGDVLHLLAAAAWLGALVLFLAAAIQGDGSKRLALRLSKFAGLGSLIVLVLLVTGIANTLIIAGWPPDWRSDWFVLLAVKLALFLMMLALAASNRWRLVPTLQRDPSGSLRALKRSLFAETGAALAIVAIVGWLGTLTPV